MLFFVQGIILDLGHLYVRKESDHGCIFCPGYCFGLGAHGVRMESDIYASEGSRILLVVGCALVRGQTRIRMESDARRVIALGMGAVTTSQWTVWERT